MFVYKYTRTTPENSHFPNLKDVSHIRLRLQHKAHSFLDIRPAHPRAMPQPYNSKIRFAPTRLIPISPSAGDVIGADRITTRVAVPDTRVDFLKCTTFSALPFLQIMVPQLDEKYESYCPARFIE